MRLDKEIHELVKYRFERAEELLEVARELIRLGKYKDANNRSYYAAFYALKAVYTLRGQDFRKHKTLLASFNKEYVATEIFPRTLGKKIGSLSLIREQSDYNDFYVASKEESQHQMEIAVEVVEAVKNYLLVQGYAL